MPIKAIKFHNFRVFRDAELPVGRVTLIIGPNGSGKTTALDGLKLPSRSVIGQGAPDTDSVRSIGVPSNEDVSIRLEWDGGHASDMIWKGGGNPRIGITGDPSRNNLLRNIMIFALQPERIAAPVSLTKTLQLGENGQGVPAVLTNLQDQYPERFEELNNELSRWLPEFDRILLDTPNQGQRSFMLRTRHGKHKITAQSLSQGTLFAIALLTVCHLPEPPSIIGLEGPDYGMHPRLLRDVLDAVNRLANPGEYNDSRPAVQVIMTTHSPYFVDLFRDRPEDVFLLEKQDLWSRFRRLSDVSNIGEILQDAHLGEAWFSGSLGGIPAHT